MARSTDILKPYTPRYRQALVALLTVCAAVLPAIAQATTYYVGPGGSDGNTGLTSGARWASVGKANNTLRAGDVVLIQPGTYGDKIDPVNGGTPTQRITYLGAINNPGAVTVSQIYLDTPYITVKGLRSNNTGTINYPSRNDSIAFCFLDGGQVFYGAKYCMVAHNTINGGISFALDQAGTMSGISNCERDTMRANTIVQNPIGGTHGFKMRGFTQYCLIDSNRVQGWFDTASGESVGIYTYNTYFIDFRDNHWSYEARIQYSSGPWKGIAFRDSSHDFTFTRDTLELGLNSSYQICGAIATSGQYGNVRNMTWDGCVYKTNSYFYNEDPIRGGTIRNSVFASSSGAVLMLQDVVTSLVVDHSTFYSAQSQAVRIDPAFGSGPNRWTSNVFYSKTAAAPSAGGGIIKLPGTSGVTSNNNVFFTSSYGSSPGDRDIVWCCYTGSKPGSGQPWSQGSGQDAASIHASPMFVDSSFATLNAHLRAGSGAIGRGASGTDAGAYPFAAAGPDLVPPAAISNLATSMISDQVAALIWTAPGDDGVLGQATAYDLRWSTSPITSGNFGAATPVPVQPVPLLGGLPQSYVMTGLTAGTTYYFAIKAVDDAGNWSALQNPLTVVTSATDGTTPAKVSDLGTTP